MTSKIFVYYDKPNYNKLDKPYICFTDVTTKTANHPKPPKTIRNHAPKTIRRHGTHRQPARNFTNQSETVHIHVKIRR